MSFRELERYESQKAAYDNYKAWKALSPDAKQALYNAIDGVKTGRAKPILSTGFIIPFNATGTIVTYVETKKILDATQSGNWADVATKVRAALAGQFFATATGTTPVVLSNPRYKFAKLSFTKKENFVDRISRITKRGYKKPSSDTISMPFGGSTMAEDFDTAVAEIKNKATVGAVAWANASTATVKQTYKFTPEGI